MQGAGQGMSTDLFEDIKPVGSAAAPTSILIEEGGESSAGSEAGPLQRLYLRLYQDPRIRFLVAGSIATLVNWLVRFPINLVVAYAIAVALATAIGMVCGFIMYRAWVFPGSNRGLPEQIRDFIIVNLLSMVITVGTAVALRELILLLGVLEVIAAAAAHAIGIAAGAVSNYCGHRRVTFR
jgi:energy-coupling factor transport system substrate-specific component